MRRRVAFGGEWVEDGGWSRKAMRMASLSVLSRSRARYVEGIVELVASVRESFQF